MLNIRTAAVSDAPQIMSLTHKAFEMYQRELTNLTPVSALKETTSDVLRDIADNHVLVAEEEGKLLGSIRYRAISDRLIYVYRFGVDPELNNGGVGSELLGRVIADTAAQGYDAITLHTNSKYFRLARYYYGKEFFVHSTDNSRGYIRALFVKALTNNDFDITPALGL